MASVMRILGWKAEGFRCPDHEINCEASDGQPFAVSLIQMPNGTGKTTTLTLLRAALSGAADEPGWDENTISEFRKKNSSAKEGYFEVRLLLDEKPATILMEFDFENGRVSYKTTYGQGQRDGFHPPFDFRLFMNENFVNFYVFDGELAQHLLDRRHTDAEVVVESLFQMNIFGRMADKIDEYWDSKTQNVGATEERGLARRKNHLAKLRCQLEKCRREQKDLQERHTTLEAQLKKKQEAYQLEINREKGRFQALNEAEAKAERLKGETREKALEVLDKMRDPHAISKSFAISMLALKDGLDRVKLPESVAKEFFDDLAGEAECICGRPIDAETAATIRSRAAGYLGSENVALLNTMKGAIKEAVGETPDQSEKDMNAKMAGLKNAVIGEREACNDRDHLRSEAKHDDPAIKGAMEDIDSLRKQIPEVTAKLGKFESKDSEQSVERTYGIEVLQKQIEEAEKKLAEITRTLSEKAKRDTLKNIINSAHCRARKRITEELCKQANDRISELMPNNGIFIERIEQNLILEGQEGGSVGENLSIAYAFLATLFNRSEHQLPFVVDSPAGPIDLAVRPKIGELIPHLTGQFIAFTISSERSGFISPLKQASSAEVQFITLFRKGSKDLEREASEKGTAVETGDGLVVTGEKFFDDFQLEDEDAA